VKSLSANRRCLPRCHRPGAPCRSCRSVAFPEALTGAEVVEFYRRLREVPEGRTDAVLRFASLNGAGDRPVSTYSGGMLQRLGLAVAMLPDADVLLLDEPTAALDPDGLAAFYTLIDRRRAQGRTVLFTSHQVGDVERLADRFLVLMRGRLVAELTQAALRDQLAARGDSHSRCTEAGGLLEEVRRISPDADWKETSWSRRAPRLSGPPSSTSRAVPARKLEVSSLRMDNSRRSIASSSPFARTNRPGARREGLGLLGLSAFSVPHCPVLSRVVDIVGRLFDGVASRGRQRRR
jgi:Cu-processing system ATP-binding protein